MRQNIQKDRHREAAVFHKDSATSRMSTSATGDLAGEGGHISIVILAVVPGEHGAQLRTDGLDADVAVLFLQSLELRSASILVLDELLGEGAVLDALQVVLHALTHVLVDAGVGVVAVLGGVGAGPAGLVQTPSFMRSTSIFNSWQTSK